MSHKSRRGSNVEAASLPFAASRPCPYYYPSTSCLFAKNSASQISNLKFNFPAVGLNSFAAASYSLSPWERGGVRVFSASSHPHSPTQIPEAVIRLFRPETLDPRPSLQTRNPEPEDPSPLVAALPREASLCPSSHSQSIAPCPPSHFTLHTSPLPHPPSPTPQDPRPQTQTQTLSSNPEPGTLPKYTHRST
jgi:hypothetical protein